MQQFNQGNQFFIYLQQLKQYYQNLSDYHRYSLNSAEAMVSYLEQLEQSFSSSATSAPPPPLPLPTANFPMAPIYPGYPPGVPVMPSPSASVVPTATPTATNEQPKETGETRENSSATEGKVSRPQKRAINSLEEAVEQILAENVREIVTVEYVVAKIFGLIPDAKQRQQIEREVKIILDEGSESGKWFKSLQDNGYLAVKKEDANDFYLQIRSPYANLSYRDALLDFFKQHPQENYSLVEAAEKVLEAIPSDQLELIYEKTENCLDKLVKENQLKLVDGFSYSYRKKT